MPLVDRISALKMPVTFIYGDHDWMDPVGGYASVENLRQAGNGMGKMYIVPHAGHHGEQIMKVACVKHVADVHGS